MRNLAILLLRDNTYEGATMCNVRLLNHVVKDLRPSKVTVISMVKSKVLQKVISEFNFPYEVKEVKTFRDFSNLEKQELYITHPPNCNFFGGQITRKQIDTHLIIHDMVSSSRLLMHLSDSQQFIMDLKVMALDRNEDFKKQPLFQEVMDLPEVDYERVLWLCNGNREIYDWSHYNITYYNEVNTGVVSTNTVYYDDRKLFQVGEACSIISKQPMEDAIFHVGGMNYHKMKTLMQITSQNPGKRFLLRSFDDRFSKMCAAENCEVTNQILLDENYIRDLSRYPAFLFLGKGGKNSYYMNKTLWDCTVAGTPFIIPRSIDGFGIYEKHFEEYMFEGPSELHDLLERVKTDRRDHSLKQRKMLEKTISNETIKQLLKKLNEHEHVRAHG